jgi:heat shock protein HslJ
VTWRRVAIVVGYALLAVACGGPARPAADTIQPPADPTGIAWELGSGMVDGVEVALVAGFPITLTITDDTAVGTAACNGYGAEVSMSGTEIAFSEMFWTEMACAPDEVMESEAQYIEALPRVSAFSGTDQRLTLTGGGVELDFVALPPVPIDGLTGKVWVLDSLIQGDSISSAGGERATLELYTDGSMLGSTGCRGLHGRYVVSGAEVQMPEMAAEGECSADLQAQDSHVVSVLGDGFRVVLDGSSLTLTSTGGQGLDYQAES